MKFETKMNLKVFLNLVNYKCVSVVDIFSLFLMSIIPYLIKSFGHFSSVCSRALLFVVFNI